MFVKAFKSLGVVSDTMFIVVQVEPGTFNAYMPTPTRAAMLTKLKGIFYGKPIYQWDPENCQWKRED